MIQMKMNQTMKRSENVHGQQFILQSFHVSKVNPILGESTAALSFRTFMYRHFVTDSFSEVSFISRASSLLSTNFG